MPSSAVTGGTRVARNAPRTLDLDLLLFGRRRLRQSGLALPHPRMHQRAFVLKPLWDIAPTASVPGHGALRPLAAHGARSADRAHSPACVALTPR